MITRPYPIIPMLSFLFDNSINYRQLWKSVTGVLYVVKNFTCQCCVLFTERKKYALIVFVSTCPGLKTILNTCQNLSINYRPFQLAQQANSLVVLPISDFNYSLFSSS